MRETYEPPNTKGSWTKEIGSMTASSSVWLQCEALLVRWQQGPAVDYLQIRVKLLLERGLEEKIRGE